MKEKKHKKRGDEVRPPIDTGGMGFNEVLKRLANTDPKEVEKVESDRNGKRTKDAPDRP